MGARMFKVNELPVRRSSWIKSCAIPRARLGWEFDDCNAVSKKDIDLIKRWLSKIESGDIIRADGQQSCGKGLLLVGSPGHGKTTLALTIIQDIIKRFDMEPFKVTDGRVLVKPCYFMTYNSIIELRGTLIEGGTDEQERLFLGLHGESVDDAYNVRVLVIDDIGKEHVTASGWHKTLLHHILRTRFNNGLPTIVTTNLPVSAWSSAYGDATGSFIHEAFVTIELESIKGDLRLT